jgi:hypothetical protein
MTSEERERMNWLCLEIQEETDHARFTALVRELNDLLESKEHRLDPTVKKQES